MPLSLIFCGTPAFAAPSLRALAEDPAFTIKLVVTQKDKPTGRGKTLTPPPVKVAALKLGLPVFQPENPNQELIPFLKEQPCDVDFLVVVAYGHILSRELLELPRVAAVNLHASLLPRWRGASPIQHALLHGDEETGVTVIQMVEELDAGPILAKKPVAIGPRETTETLARKLEGIGAELLRETLKYPLKPTPQPSEGVTHCRKLSRRDGELDPQTSTAQEFDRSVRALNPWPGVTLRPVMLSSSKHQSEPLKILEMSLEKQEESIPLQCKEGTVWLVTVQPLGGTPMSGAAWARGRR